MSVSSLAAGDVGTSPAAIESPSSAPSMFGRPLRRSHGWQQYCAKSELFPIMFNDRYLLCFKLWARRRTLGPCTKLGDGHGFAYKWRAKWMRNIQKKRRNILGHRELEVVYFCTPSQAQGLDRLDPAVIPSFMPRIGAADSVLPIPANRRAQFEVAGGPSGNSRLGEAFPSA